MVANENEDLKIFGLLASVLLSSEQPAGQLIKGSLSLLSLLRVD